MQVKDLGSVLHMVGGTAAAYMIFCLPGLLLMNAAIVKRSNEVLNFTLPSTSANDSADYALVGRMHELRKRSFIRQERG